MATPTGPYATRSRDGWSKIEGLAKTLCRANSEFGPLLRSKWSGSPAVLALLAIIDQLCPLITPASDDVFDVYNGGDNSAIDDEGGQLYIGRLPDATDPTP